MPETGEQAPSTLDDAAAPIRDRTRRVLAAGQVLGGVAFGATLSLGAAITADITGDDGLSGLATAAVTLGTAVVAMPLAAVARRRGRRLALTLGMAIALVGVMLVVVGTGIRSFPALLVAFAMIGAGQAANLQSRFAATDLSTDRTRGRDLSTVVWATTIGAVLGPNLIGPGDAVGAALAMPPMTGPYVFTIVAQVAGIVLYSVGLRPDPLLLARRIQHQHGGASAAEQVVDDNARAARYAMFAIAGAHAVMVAVMAMTPVHLLHHGVAMPAVGVTISLHIAGMYALAPVFGILSDRLGRTVTILLGQGLFVAALIVGAAGAHSAAAVTVALVLLGLGWSATTVAGSALLTEASSSQLRTRRQGRSDALMSLVGAAGAVLAGVVLSAIGFDGLSLSSLVVVVAVVALAPLGRHSR